MDSQLSRALNDHLKLEFQAAHTYLAMSHWLELNDLPGFSQWMRSQSEEEVEHAQRFISHLLEREIQPELPQIDKPRLNYESAQEIAEAFLASEKQVTQAIFALYDMAEKASDRPAQLLLQWFVREQVEEENVAQAVLGRLRLAGDSGVGLLMVDQELGAGRLPGVHEEPAP